MATKRNQASRRSAAEPVSNDRTKKKPARTIVSELAWVRLYNASSDERVTLARAGLPASLVTTLVRDLAKPKEWLYSTLGVSRATLDRKIKAKARLGRAESESVLAMARLIGQVEAMVSASGEPTDFDAARWVADWLEHPVPALGGKTPASYMDTEAGRTLVSDLVAQMQSGAYA